MTSHRLSHAIWLAGFLALGAMPSARAMPAPSDADRILTVDEAPRLRLAQAQPAPSPSPQAGDASAPADQQAAPEEPIGNVATLTGVATVTRNDTDTPLNVKDDIYLNDVVKTQASSSLSITFSDATTFRLSANAQVTIDTYVYEESGANNAGTFDIAKGTVAFVAAQVAKTGDMQITTPTATLGIRGTTGVVDVPEGAAATSANNVNIKLYPDADGRVGHIDVNDRQGARLGALTQGASGFAIRAGAAGVAGATARFAAVPITLTPQQQQRDQGFVRQVHTAQTTGRQIFVERRDFRRANPTVVNPNAPRRQFQPGQPGQNRPGQPGQTPGQNRPGQPGQPQQNGTPNGRQGQQQPGQPSRPGQNAQPATPGQPGATPRPGQTTRPATPGQPNTPTRPGQITPSPIPGQPGMLPRSGQNGLPPAPGQPRLPPRTGPNTLPPAPGQPGLPPRSGPSTLPPAPGQPGLPSRSGPGTLPPVPGQPGLPPRPAPGTLPPAPGQLPTQPHVQPGSPPPLPNGQPLLRQPPGPGRPQFVPPGAARPGFQNRPVVPRPGKPAPPPKDKKKER